MRPLPVVMVVLPVEDLLVVVGLPVVTAAVLRPVGMVLRPVGMVLRLPQEWAAR